MPHQEWIECGQGRLLHPNTELANRVITTEVVELKDFGRIFEVYHYGNAPEQTQRLILAAPALLRELDLRAGNLSVMSDYLELWLNHGATKPKRADTPTGWTMVQALRLCSQDARQLIAKVKGTQ